MSDGTEKVEVYSDIEVALGQHIYEDRYAASARAWHAVHAPEVWYQTAREMLAFINEFVCANRGFGTVDAAIEAARAEEQEKLEPLQNALKDALDAVLDGEGLTALYLKAVSDQRERDAEIAERWFLGVDEDQNAHTVKRDHTARQIAAAIREGE